MSESRRMRTSVVVVNWNAGGALEACLASLSGERAVADEIILVDNASQDGSVAAARVRAPWAQIIENPANLGFAGGANRGAAAATGDILLFLNPDAQVRPGAIGKLVDAFRAFPRAGIAGGGLVDARGRWQPSAARFGPASHLLLDTTLGRLPARWRRRPYVVDWVYGTFMAVRREVFRELGGFDPSYFCYGEDLDFCHRAARRGVQVIVVPEAQAVHGTSPSATQHFGEGRMAAVVEGELRFYARHGPRTAVVVFRGLAAAKFATKAALAAAAGRVRVAARYARVVRACLSPVPA